MARIKQTLAKNVLQGDLWLIFGVFGVILLLILPISPFLLDILLAFNIAISLLVFLVIMYLRDPSDFTGFPTILLCVTLFRLGLNVASTRLILLDGSAGQIIEAFGSFVVRGNYVVGLIVFAILILINFVVITKGAGRIAEVAARFTLDAMPGKQMAIDAELNAGVIGDERARERRRKVEQEADFYGSMDGASKFVRGDAIAAVLITLINIFGGFAIGIFQMEMSASESVERFTLLSIGDSLVSQIPALITSTAAGILVTRGVSKTDLGDELSQQLLTYPRALGILSVLLGFMSIVPGMPFVPFMLLACGAGYAARLLSQRDVMAALDLKSEERIPCIQADSPTKPVQSRPRTRLNLCSDWIRFRWNSDTVLSAWPMLAKGDLLKRVSGVRRNFAQEIGILVPPVKLRDNLQLNSNEYRILLKGLEVGKGVVYPQLSLAMNATESEFVPEGEATVEPVFGLPAVWVSDAYRRDCERHGYTVVDGPSVLVTHLSEVIKRHCHEILTRQDVQKLLDNLRETHAAVVNELVPDKLSVGHVQRILRNLLAENVSIRNLSGVLESISDYSEVTKNVDELSEFARRALAETLSHPFVNDAGNLNAITLDPRLEQELAKGLTQSSQELSLIVDPDLAQKLIAQLSQAMKSMIAHGHQPLLLCAPPLRLALRRFIAATLNELTVLSYSEISPLASVERSATISI